MGVATQLVAIAFMVPLGISQAVRIRVSNLLGTFYPSLSMFCGSILHIVSVCP